MSVKKYTKKLIEQSFSCPSSVLKRLQINKKKRKSQNNKGKRTSHDLSFPNNVYRIAIDETNKVLRFVIRARLNRYRFESVCCFTAIVESSTVLRNSGKKQYQSLSQWNSGQSIRLKRNWMLVQTSIESCQRLLKNGISSFPAGNSAQQE